MDGTLSANDFKLACFYLIDLWAMHCSELPPWHWQKHRLHPVIASNIAVSSYCSQPDGYLVLEDVFLEDALGLTECSSEKADIAAEDNEALDTAALAVSPGSKGHFFTYHVIYSEVFRVPKLYLKGRFADGQPLCLQDAQKLFSIGVAEDSTMWTFLTYEEHPYLHMPWMVLHPCGTSKLMSIILSESDERAIDTSKRIMCSMGEVVRSHGSASIHCYMLTWLSFASQAVKLKLPLGFSKCFAKIKDPEEPAKQTDPISDAKPLGYLTELALDFN